MNFFRNIYFAIVHALAAPGRFIQACNELSEATRQQTAALGIISADLVLQLEHLQYLSQSERSRNQREGRRV